MGGGEWVRRRWEGEWVSRRTDRGEEGKAVEFERKKHEKKKNQKGGHG